VISVVQKNITMENIDLTSSPSFKIEEYKSLRQQIDNQSKLMIQVFSFSIISSFAFLGYFLQLLNGTRFSFLILHLLFAPSFIIVPCAYLIKDMRDEIYKWGTYIQVFIENENSSLYEGALGRIRERYRTSESFNTMFLTFWSFTLACVCLYAFLAKKYFLLELWQPLPWLCVIWLLHRAENEFKVIPSKKRKIYLEEWRSINISTDSLFGWQQEMTMKATSKLSTDTYLGKHLFEICNLIETKIAHEFSLINHRITWLATSQSFLFIAVATLLAIHKCPMHPAINVFLIFIPMLGLVLSIQIFRAVNAALTVLKDHLLPERADLVTECNRLAGTRFATLGPDRLTDFVGAIPAKWIPSAFIISWLFVLCLVGWIIIYP
jgi:hypothetical protein